MFGSDVRFSRFPNRVTKAPILFLFHMEVSPENIKGSDRDDSESESDTDSTLRQFVQVSSSTQPIFLRKIPEVPPELWVMMTALSKLCSKPLRCLTRILRAVFTASLQHDDRAPVDKFAIYLSCPRSGAFASKSSSRLVVPAALRNLYLAPEDGRPMCASALRTLAWNLEPGTDELATISKSPAVSRISRKHQSNAEATRPSISLKCLGRLVMKREDYTTWPVLLGAFSAALKTIPSLSPLLHALKLKLYLHDRRHAQTDFSSFLRGHPQLRHVNLDVKDMRILTETEVPVYLPRLRVFTAIAARARELEHLFILFPHSNDEQDDVPTLFPPNVGPTVSWLNVWEIDSYGPTRYPEQLSQHANTAPASRPSRISNTSDRKSATTIFSRKKLAALIRDTLLPSLVRLSDVRFHLRGNRSGPATELCDENNRRYGPPDFLVEYRFRVDRAGRTEPLVEKKDMDV
ncbi:hypothetical protein C8R44DRAFT_737933 [Mycena epipterygia]|nr:hypothetical protein C8R44DRAFT_737933 [Mycena epipterygia]